LTISVLSAIFSFLGLSVLVPRGRLDYRVDGAALNHGFDISPDNGEVSVDLGGPICYLQPYGSGRHFLVCPWACVSDWRHTCFSS
jgi:hypothetical protein